MLPFVSEKDILCLMTVLKNQISLKKFRRINLTIFIRISWNITDFLKFGYHQGWINHEVGWHVCCKWQVMSWQVGPPHIALHTTTCLNTHSLPLSPSYWCLRRLPEALPHALCLSQCNSNPWLCLGLL